MFSVYQNHVTQFCYTLEPRLSCNFFTFPGNFNSLSIFFLIESYSATVSWRPLFLTDFLLDSCVPLSSWGFPSLSSQVVSTVCWILWILLFWFLCSSQVIAYGIFPRNVAQEVNLLKPYTPEIFIQLSYLIDSLEC